mmetsp:Transcript_10880/g.11015  ORF Transcript_10880/g.11015 Transcript_10880/m.11015 type:complete len:105 (+) Transcript_10880:87-401(+)
MREIRENKELVTRQVKQFERPQSQQYNRLRRATMVKPGMTSLDVQTIDPEISGEFEPKKSRGHEGRGKKRMIISKRNAQERLQDSLQRSEESSRRMKRQSTLKS